MRNLILLSTVICLVLTAGCEPRQGPRAASSTAGWESVAEPADLAMAKSKTVDEWTSQLRDPNPRRRYEAAQALREYGPEAKAAVPALARLAQDTDVDSRLGAVRALATTGRGDKLAIQTIVKTFRDTNRYVREAAFQALEDMGPEAQAAVPALTELLQGKDAVVRNEVDPQTEEKLSDEERKQDLRPSAARTLGKIGPGAQAAVPALTEALSDEDYNLRRSAAYALGEIGPGVDSAAIPVLIEMLEHDKLGLHDVAAQALVKIDPQTAVPAIRQRVLVNRHGFIPSEVVHALGNAGAEAVPTLVELVRTSDARVRQDAALALGKIGQPAIPALRELVQEKDEAIQRAAALGFGKMGADALPAISELSPETRFTVAVALEGLKQEGVATLLELLRDAAPSVRRAAAVALGNIHAAPGGSATRPHSFYQQQHWPQNQDTALAAVAIVELLRDTDTDVRWAAVQALGSMKAAEAVTPLTELLKDREAGVRRDAATALGRMGWMAQPAIPALKALLQDRDADVCRAADEALQKIQAAEPKQSSNARGMGSFSATPWGWETNQNGAQPWTTPQSRVQPSRPRPTVFVPVPPRRPSGRPRTRIGRP
jgi:HEAT repeat protein